MLIMRRILLLPVLSVFFLHGAAVAQSKQPAKVVGDGDLVSWVDATVKERMPAADERRFDEIGWAKDIRDALRLAKESGRPVFLFTHDGRMNLGRC
jgi:hypothetical protein